ncbi:hypothetical protein JXA59_01720 [Patescibacteria group bacterium]|nr:hypothetical protein [Patescibacteria group bacterium]
MLNKKLRRKKIIIGIFILLAIAGAMLAWRYLMPSNGAWEKTFPLAQTTEHSYSLRVKLERPLYYVAVPAAVQGTIEVLRDGVSLADLTADPDGRTGVNFVAISYIDGYMRPTALYEAAGIDKYNSRDFDPTIKLSITPHQAPTKAKAGNYRLMSYAYSAQALKEWQYDYKNQTDKITGNLTFDRGFAQFGYLYGDAAPGSVVDFHIEVLLSGKPIVIDHPIEFTQRPNWNTRVYRQSTEGIYYDVTLTPFLRKVRYLPTEDGMAIDADAGVRTRIEKAVRVKVIARNSVTGKIETNPFQRVKLSVLPLFLVSDSATPTPIEYPGQLTYQGVSRSEQLPEYWKQILSDPYGEGITDPDEMAYWDNTSMVREDDVYLSRLLSANGLVEGLSLFNFGFDPTFWFSYRNIPAEYLNAQPRVQIDLDLINGQGEALFLPNSKYGDKDVLREYMVQKGLDDKTVEQELTKAEINDQLKNFVWPKVVMTVQPTDYHLVGYQSCGSDSGVDQYSDRALPDMSFREQADIQCPALPSSDYHFLNRTWHKDSSLVSQRYTVVPLTPDMLSRAERSLPAPNRLWSIIWLAITSQLAQLILGITLIIVISRRQRGRKSLKA